MSEKVLEYVPAVRAGDVCEGPNGMGYRVTKDCYPGDIVDASQFEPINEKTPALNSTDDFPKWLEYWRLSKASVALKESYRPHAKKEVLDFSKSIHEGGVRFKKGGVEYSTMPIGFDEYCALDEVFRVTDGTVYAERVDGDGGVVVRLIDLAYATGAYKNELTAA